MKRDEALELVRQALAKVLKRPVELSPEADLVADQILDSLDTLLFFAELEKTAGLQIPDQVDLAQAGFYRVPTLLDHLCGERPCGA